MRFNPITRRHFLQGTGGFTLSLPLLPSLWPKELRSQTQAPKGEFSIMCLQDHGGALKENVVGPLAVQPDHPAFQHQLLYSGGTAGGQGSFTDHFYRFAALDDLLSTPDSGPDSGQLRLSEVIGAPYTQYLNKSLILSGVGYGRRLSHHNGHLGNLATGSGGIPPSASICHLMAQSSSVYPSSTGVTVPHVRVFRHDTTNPDKVFSHNEYGVGLPRSSSSTHGLFNLLFSGGVFPPGSSQPTYVVDQALEAVQSSLSLPNLSVDDKNSLNAYLESLFQVQNNLLALHSCSDEEAPNPNYTYNNLIDPGDLTVSTATMAQTAEILALAIYCGLTRVATIKPLFSTDICNENPEVCFDNPDPDDDGYHQAIAHKSYKPDLNPLQQSLLTESNRRRYLGLFSQFVEKLDALPTEDGGTLLDKGSVYYLDECGTPTLQGPNGLEKIDHDNTDQVCIIAGSSNGYWKTNRYIDYRNYNAHPDLRARPGLLYNQLWANMMMAMGMPPDEYENPATFEGPGYGHYDFSGEYNIQGGEVAFPPPVINQSGDPLPHATYDDED